VPMENAWVFQRDIVSKKCNGGVIYLPTMNSFQNKFLVIFKTKLLYAYTENTLNGKISTESVYISVHNNTNLKKFRFFVPTLHGMD
jgi:hypothetical protein